MRVLSVAVLALLLSLLPLAARGQASEPLIARAATGESVQLDGASIEVEVAGGQALTTIELQLRNPGGRVLEGQLAFPLQPGQEVAGFALDIDGVMHDAVPVPKARGREVFEAIERRNVDPALLERTEGNYFRLRVFPVPPGGVRRVRIDLVESLARVDGARQLRLPLDFAEGLGSVPVRVRGPLASADAATLERAADGGQAATLGAAQLKAGGALLLRWPLSGEPQVRVQSHGGQRWFHVEVPLPEVSAPRRLPRRIGLLWDASGSAQARDQALEFALLDKYFAAVGDAEVQLQVLRDRASPVRRFTVRGGDWAALRVALGAEVQDGATDLGAWKADARVQEYLLFGDGLSNYGEGPVPSLSPEQRLYAVNSAGARADAVRLRALAESRGGRLVELATPAELERALSELLRETPRLRRAGGSGVRDVVAASPFPQGGALSLAGRLESDTAVIELDIEASGRVRRVRLPLEQDRPVPGRLLALAWAGYRMRELQAEPVLNRDTILRLGPEFGLVTPETSLLVLETLDDYVRYDILPPAPLREAFLAQRRALAADEAGQARAHLEQVVAAFEEKQAWWATDFRGKAPKLSAQDVPAPGSAAPVLMEEPAAVAATAAPPAPPPPADFAGPDDAELDAVEVVGSRIESADAATDVADEEARAVIVLQPWSPDSDVARRLRAVPAEQLYAVYLEERAAHRESSAFFLDVADLLLERGQRDLALRVLSNLAEMQLENRALLRVLGYRLMQAKAPELAVPVFRRVLAVAEEEPQSHRDLGLALDAAGRPQEAVEALVPVVQQPWDPRFGGIALIALAEINAIDQRERGRLDLGRLDPRLRRNLPVELRAVLTWDADNTDMDLWVTQPDGERCYYSNRFTAAGGRISEDFTGGYGPEEYSIRRAAPGKYRIEVDYFGDSQALVSGQTTVQVWLSTDFGTPRQRDQRLTVRLAPDDDNAMVGEFEVR